MVAGGCSGGCFGGVVFAVGKAGQGELEVVVAGEGAEVGVVLVGGSLEVGRFDVFWVFRIGVRRRADVVLVERGSCMSFRLALVLDKG